MQGIFNSVIKWSLLEGFKKRYNIVSNTHKPSSKDFKEANNELMEKILYDWVVHQQMNNGNLSGRANYNMCPVKITR